MKKITTGGTFRLQHRLRFIPNALTGHHIGLEESVDGIWVLDFNTILLATFDERDDIMRG